jgi:hypothetical protein
MHLAKDREENREKHNPSGTKCSSVTATRTKSVSKSYR